MENHDRTAIYDRQRTVLPAFPTLVPLIRDLTDHIEHEGRSLQRTITNFHSLASTALDDFKRAFLHAVRRNPHISRLLPPLVASRRQLRGHPRHHTPFAAYNFAAIIPGDSVAAVVVSNGVLNFLNIYNTMLVVRLILTWFPEPPQIIVNPLSTLCDPYLNIFRGIIPPLGGTIDLSPILAFLVLNAFTNSAAALPAEMPASTKTGIMTKHQKLGTAILTGPQKAWLKRQAYSSQVEVKESS